MPPLVTGSVPVTPVESGRPVAFVSVPLDGVPNAPPLTTNAPAVPVFTPRAVTTPVPVVIVEGATPAPPPIIKEFAARTAEDAQALAEEKYGIPPLVPATVNARVPEVVTGEPDTEMMPPVNVWPTDVTVPPPAVEAIVIEPAPFVTVMPLPAVIVASV